MGQTSNIPTSMEHLHSIELVNKAIWMSSRNFSHLMKLLNWLISKLMMIKQPLHKAASNDQHKIVEELLSVKDISKIPTDKDGNTPLHLACLGGFEKTVNKFLDPKHEYDVEILNNNGENVLHLAAQGGNVKAVETLVTRMKRVDQKNNSGKTSIDLAKSKNHDLVIAVLRRYL